MTGMQTSGSNSALRGEVMKQVSDSILPLESQIAVLRKRIGEAKAKLKAQGIRMAAFNAAHQARQLDDGQKAEDWRRDYDEAFAALGVGQQLDWLDVEEQRADAVQVAEAAGFDGLEAGKAGAPRVNPFPPGTPEAEEWDVGYAAGRPAGG